MPLPDAPAGITINSARGPSGEAEEYGPIVSVSGQIMEDVKAFSKLVWKAYQDFLATEHIAAQEAQEVLRADLEAEELVAKELVAKNSWLEAEELEAEDSPDNITLVSTLSLSSIPSLSDEDLPDAK